MFEVLTATLATGVLILFFACWLIYWVLKQPTGTPKMKEIASAIQEGATAYLKRQYITLSVFVVIIFLLIGYLLPGGWDTAIAFFAGVVCSALAGYIGMWVSVRANLRTAQAAGTGLKQALLVAFRGGSITGLALIGLGLIGVSSLYLYYNSLIPLIGFGLGASLMSLFARVGGGIYTKAADVGADLVGKLEKNIPEDDPRNPAVIADNVGDNVGDCAGMAADLFESYVVTIIAAMLLGAFAAQELGGAQNDYILLPLVIGAVGGIATVLGSFFMSLSGKKIMHALYKPVIATALLSLVGFYFVSSWNMNLFYATVVGVVVTILIGLITEYYTAKNYSPVQKIAEASETGAGTNLISGLGIGLQSTALPVLVIVLAIIASHYLAGLYGVALAAAAMLSMTGVIIALDAYGPITDNAGGIAEMSKMPSKIRKTTDALDSVGNTTKATTKGFAIAGAALGALALFAAFSHDAGIETLDLLKPAVVVGLFIGGALPFLFASFLMNAVGRAAFQIVGEVRRQFKSIKGLMQGTAKPDYAKCVDISTAAALKELMIPGLLAVTTPIIIGLLFGVQAVGGLLAGAIVSGFLLALFMSTTGAAWDNAKKLIEDGKHGGKGSDAHKAAIVGDTVGDPFKDTAGPSLNALIKVLNTVSLVFASFIVANTLNLI
ncbi:MAG: sodium-translocating pyrophosphatase [Candidatus Micrarchaeota archaeon]